MLDNTGPDHARHVLSVNGTTAGDASGTTEGGARLRSSRCVGGRRSLWDSDLRDPRPASQWRAHAGRGQVMEREGRGKHLRVRRRYGGRGRVAQLRVRRRLGGLVSRAEGARGRFKRSVTCLRSRSVPAFSREHSSLSGCACRGHVYEARGTPSVCKRV